MVSTAPESMRLSMSCAARRSISSTGTRTLQILIENALSPAKVISVIADDDEKTAKVIVPDYQLSLAIGKEGQNARLAARLTGFQDRYQERDPGQESPASSMICLVTTVSMRSLQIMMTITPTRTTPAITRKFLRTHRSRTRRRCRVSSVSRR